MEIKDLEKRKKMVMDFLGDPLYVPMKIKEMAVFFGITRENRRELEEVLLALIAQGKVERTKKGKFIKAKARLVEGEFLANPRGFGFVRVEGMEEDIFIPAEGIKNALHKDRVQVMLEEAPPGKRQEGHVVRILDHANKTLVGMYRQNNAFGFVLPDDIKIQRDIHIGPGLSKQAKTGDKVVVELLSFGEGKKKPEGRVVEILGKKNEKGVDILSLAESFSLPREFPLEVREEAKHLESLRLTPERRDFRDLVTVTIDGEDAKDLDDAVTLEREGALWRLGVHIADVSHYVRQGSALDWEALKRGTSVYLVDRVIPMLPPELSNGICSLNQGEDRLALSCIMDIDEKGHIVGHEITESIIQVNQRMTYTDVNAILMEKEAPQRKQYKEYISLFKDFARVSRLLRKNRERRGAIDFDLPESKVILDQRGRAVDIKPYERNAATNLIEDFMLAANETVAEEYFWQELPFLYRVHEKPDPEKLKSLGIFINQFGFSLRQKNGDILSKELQKLLQKITGTPGEAVISRIMLRSMKQARYDTECLGHYGLAAKYYTHFTSPIRRYPDLQIHRIIKENLQGGIRKKKLEYYRAILPHVAEQASVMERRAEEAERETVKYKKCEYMLRHLGEEFEGVISGVTGFGLFVELENTVEGFVRLSDIPGDYFVYDQEAYALAGEVTNRRYTLGQRVRIKVYDVNILSRTIDFKLIERNIWQRGKN